MPSSSAYGQEMAPHSVAAQDGIVHAQCHLERKATRAWKQKNSGYRQTNSNAHLLAA